MSVMSGAMIRILLVILATAAALATSTENDDIQTRLNMINKPAVTSFTTPSGDVINCVDIKKQRAFDHPKLGDQEIFMKPSHYPFPGDVARFKSKRKTNQAADERSCPDGTVAVKPVTAEELKVESTLTVGMGRLEFAGVQSNRAGSFDIATGVNFVNRYSPVYVAPLEYSRSILMLSDNVNYLYAGSTVSPIYDDSSPHLFSEWKIKNALNNSGCVNNECPGFMQISRTITLGMNLLDIPGASSNPFLPTIRVVVYYDPIQSVWWLVVEDDELVGYWPGKIFYGFSKAPNVYVGGVVHSVMGCYPHSDTGMGTGIITTGMFKYDAYFDDVFLVNSTHQPQSPPPRYFEKKISYRLCYNAVKRGADTETQDYKFYYGGPGGICCCYYSLKGPGRKLLGSCSAAAAAAASNNTTIIDHHQ